MKTILNTTLFLLVTLFATACSKPAPPPPPAPTHGTAAISVTTYDAVNEIDVAVEGAIVDIYDESGQFVTRGTTDVDGNFSVSLLIGSYTAKAAAQGYLPSPIKGIQPVPFAIAGDLTTEKAFDLKAHSSATATAQLSGSTGVSGALVVAIASANGFAESSLTDANGDFVIFNVEPGTYEIEGFKAGYSTPASVNQVVEADMSYDTLDLAMITDSGYTLDGSITFLAVGNGSVDVTLLHPVTRDVIPGLSVMTDAGTYQMTEVPNGSYLAWASLKNDGYVMDYDWIVKNGGLETALSLTIADADETRDFSVTGAITIGSPSNAANEAIPEVVNTVTPTFNWTAYSSTSVYAIEVLDTDGNILWGGYADDDATPGVDTLIDISIAGSATSVTYAGAIALEDGETYQWRLIALKNENNTGQKKIISVSEDVMGLFKVVLPAI